MPWPHSLWSISIDSIARNWLTRKSLNARRFCLVEPALYTEISGTWESSGHFPAEVGAASHFVPTLEFPFFLPSEICCPEPWNHCCLKTGDPRAKHGSCCNKQIHRPLFFTVLNSVAYFRVFLAKSGDWTMSLAVEQRASMYCTSPGFCLHSFSGTWIQHSDLKGGGTGTPWTCVSVHMCVCALGVREHASINERWQRTRSPCWGAPLEVPVITKFRTTIPRGSLRSGWKVSVSYSFVISNRRTTAFWMQCFPWLIISILSNLVSVLMDRTPETKSVKPLFSWCLNRIQLIIQPNLWLCLLSTSFCSKLIILWRILSFIIISFRDFK